MFTGIAEGVGKISSYVEENDIVCLEIMHSMALDDLCVNDSICCSGICLTVVKTDGNTFNVEMVPETIERSNAKYWEIGTIINLERAMLQSTRMGGHYLQGHVDTVSEIKEIKNFENSSVFTFGLDKEVDKYIVEKGYIGLDGLSLTIAKKRLNTIDIALIPHTLSITNFSDKKISDFVNLEIDIVAKYVENFIKPHIEK